MSAVVFRWKHVAAMKTMGYAVAVREVKSVARHCARNRVRLPAALTRGDGYVRIC